jgi:hypothetical protein
VVHLVDGPGDVRTSPSVTPTTTRIVSCRRLSSSTGSRQAGCRVQGRGRRGRRGPTHQRSAVASIAINDPPRSAASRCTPGRRPFSALTSRRSTRSPCERHCGGIDAAALASDRSPVGGRAGGGELVGRSAARLGGFRRLRLGRRRVVSTTRRTAVGLRRWRCCTGASGRTTGPAALTRRRRRRGIRRRWTRRRRLLGC